MSKTQDLRSEAEKARADLKRNAEMDSATVMPAPFMRQPSVTPATFGEHGGRARVLSGSDQGLEAGGVAPGAGERSGETESIVEADQRVAGRDDTRPATNQPGRDALSRK